MKAAELKNGDIMFACPDKLWALAFAKWQKDTNKPCPMPEKHLMFTTNHDAAYEIVRRFEIDSI